jgi:hypothetical protein
VIMTIIVIVAAVTILVPVMIIMVLVMVVIPVITMIFLVTWYILAPVPVLMHKVDPLAAGVVLVAVFAPVFGMIRRYDQIDRRAIRRFLPECHRTTIDDLRRRRSALRHIVNVSRWISFGYGTIRFFRALPQS